MKERKRKPSPQGPIRALRCLLKGQPVVINHMVYVLYTTEEGRRYLAVDASDKDQTQILPFPISFEAFLDLTTSNIVEPKV